MPAPTPAEHPPGSAVVAAWRSRVAGLLVALSLLPLVTLHSSHGLFDAELPGARELVAACEHSQAAHAEAAHSIVAPECAACLLSRSLAGSHVPATSRLERLPKTPWRTPRTLPKAVRFAAFRLASRGPPGC